MLSADSKKEENGRAVAIFSGGMDSTTLLAQLLAWGYDVIPLMVNYGQRHAKELEYARRVLAYYGLEGKEADLRGITHLLGGSSQTSPDVAVPEGHYAEETMKLTVVPNRNMIMLSVAVGLAVAEGARQVFYGAHDGDHTIYPDCRVEFVDRLNAATNVANWQPVAIRAPFVERQMDKTDIARLGSLLHAPLHLTWSCYKGGVVHCGRCGTCVERREAFQLAGLVDPTVYEEAA